MKGLVGYVSNQGSRGCTDLWGRSGGGHALGYDGHVGRRGILLLAPPVLLHGHRLRQNAWKAAQSPGTPQPDSVRYVVARVTTPARPLLPIRLAGMPAVDDSYLHMRGFLLPVNCMQIGRSLL